MNNNQIKKKRDALGKEIFETVKEICKRLVRYYCHKAVIVKLAIKIVVILLFFYKYPPIIYYNDIIILAYSVLLSCYMIYIYSFIGYCIANTILDLYDDNINKKLESACIEICNMVYKLDSDCALFKHYSKNLVK